MKENYVIQGLAELGKRIKDDPAFPKVEDQYNWPYICRRAAELLVEAERKPFGTSEVEHRFALKMARNPKNVDTDEIERARAIRKREFASAVEPVHQWICNYGNPYTTVVVCMDGAQAEDGFIGIPLRVPD